MGHPVQVCLPTMTPLGRGQSDTVARKSLWAGRYVTSEELTITVLLTEYLYCVDDGDGFRLVCLDLAAVLPAVVDIHV